MRRIIHAWKYEGRRGLAWPLAARVAASADAAVVVVAAPEGVMAQTKEHVFLARTLGVPQIAVAVNKMDLVDFSEDRYNEIVEDFTEFAARLDIHDLRFVPVSALEGDNVVDVSERTPWYLGPPVLRLLEEIYIAYRG